MSLKHDTIEIGGETLAYKHPNPAKAECPYCYNGYIGLDPQTGNPYCVACLYEVNMEKE